MRTGERDAWDNKKFRTLETDGERSYISPALW